MATIESIKAFQQSHPKEYLKLERYCDNCYLTRLLHHYGFENYNCPKENIMFIEIHSSSPSNSYYTNSNDQNTQKLNFIRKKAVSLLIEVHLERINEKANIDTRKTKV